VRNATPTITIPTSADAYEAAIEGLTALDELLIRAARYPSIYRAGVQYRRESRDTWRHVADVIRLGGGDCEDLSAARAAELRVSGIDPGAYVHVYRSGPQRYHAVVGRSDGTAEDPSWILGMKTREKWRPLERVGGRRKGTDVLRT